MGSENQSLVSAWVAKARSDLDTARILICGEERHFDTGVYHCQQAAEKSLKAFLTRHDIVFPKTHNLGELAVLAEATEPLIAELREPSDFLTPFATEFRYPGDMFQPPEEDALLALAYAERIPDAICSVLAIAREQVGLVPQSQSEGDPTSEM